MGSWVQLPEAIGGGLSDKSFLGKKKVWEDGEHRSAGARGSERAATLCPLPHFSLHWLVVLIRTALIGKMGFSLDTVNMHFTDGRKEAENTSFLHCQRPRKELGSQTLQIPSV